MTENSNAPTPSSFSGRSRIPSPRLTAGRSKIPSPTTASPLTRVASPTCVAETRNAGSRARVSSPQFADERSQLSPGKRVTSPAGQPSVSSRVSSPLTGERSRVSSPSSFNRVVSPQLLDERSRVSPSPSAERRRATGRTWDDSDRPQTYFSNSRRPTRRATDEKKGPPTQPTLYLTVVRHGETNHNVNRILQGHIDTPLNKAGCEQSELLAKRLQKMKFDHIYTSDLARARRTAKFIAKLHPNVPFDEDMRLRESDLGRLSGLTIYDAMKLIKKEKSVWEDYGEPVEDFKARVVDFFDEIVRKHLPRMSPKSTPCTPSTPLSECSSPELQNPPKRTAHVLVVTHAGTINQLVKSHIIMDLGFSVKDYKSIQSKAKNTSVTKVVIRRAAGDELYETEDESDEDRSDAKKTEEAQDIDNASVGPTNDGESSSNESERNVTSDGERTLTGDSENVQDPDTAEPPTPQPEQSQEEESTKTESVITEQEEVKVDSASTQQPAANDEQQDAPAEGSQSLEQPKKSRPPPLVEVKAKKSPRPLQLEGELTVWSDVAHLTSANKRTHGDSAIDEHIF